MNHLEDLYDNIKASVEACEGCDIVPMLYQDAKNMLELLKRHKQKDIEDEHPSERVYDSFFGTCPTCGKLVGTRLIHGAITYCPYCGQMLRWKLNGKPDRSS